MKKIKLFIIVPIIALSLIGCGKSNYSVDVTDSDEANSSEDNSATDTITEADESLQETTGIEEISQEIVEPRIIMTGGEVNDKCLELRTVFIDFSSYENADLNQEVEKRSETNIVIYCNRGDSNESSVQYSTSLATVGETKFFDTTFPDGYEFVADENYGDYYYGITKEENGTRVVILQDVGDENYLSIRTFDKTSADVQTIIENIRVKNLPVYYY